jgi:hypothetical protein
MHKRKRAGWIIVPRVWFSGPILVLVLILVRVLVVLFVLVGVDFGDSRSGDGARRVGMPDVPRRRP